MMTHKRGPLLALLAMLAMQSTNAFVPTSSTKATATSTKLAMTDNRRSFLSQAALLPAALGLLNSNPANAQVFLDPAMYGDQENRVSAVDSLKESVRRAILQDPTLAPSFYQLALLDGLSYNAATKDYGPDGRVVKAVLNSKDDSDYMKKLQEACKILIQSTINLKKLTSITVADSVALGGAEALESIGGPVVSVQLGRTDAPKNLNPNPDLDLNLLSGKSSGSAVSNAFKKAGLTEREMTALLGGLLTLQQVEITMKPGEWKKTRGKYRERGKIGRMDEFKKLTDEDIAEMEEYDESESDSDWYIAESFGTRDESFGAKASDGMTVQNFNKYMKLLSDQTAKKGGGGGSGKEFGWIGSLLLDKNSPTIQAWLQKYGQSYLNYNKDLSIAYNAITQLGAEYTGGKYESLLKNKPRKTLNDDDLNLGF